MILVRLPGLPGLPGRLVEDRAKLGFLSGCEWIDPLSAVIGQSKRLIDAVVLVLASVKAVLEIQVTDCHMSVRHWVVPFVLPSPGAVSSDFCRGPSAVKCTLS